MGFPAQELNVEAIAAVRPDRIMGYAGPAFETGGQRNALSQIAPTVLYSFGSDADWRQRFHIEAEILGRTGQAQELESDYGGPWRLENGASSVPGSVVLDAGGTLFEPHAQIGDLNDTGSFCPDISAERLDLLLLLMRSSSRTSPSSAKTNRSSCLRRTRCRTPCPQSGSVG